MANESALVSNKSEYQSTVCWKQTTVYSKMIDVIRKVWFLEEGKTQNESIFLELLMHQFSSVTKASR